VIAGTIQVHQLHAQRRSASTALVTQPRCTVQPRHQTARSMKVAHRVGAPGSRKIGSRRIVMV
jgi:hypothetical protein